MPEQLVIVDGNNVMGSRPDGWWRDRAGAARRLVAQLGGWAAAADRDVLVVFDGAPPAELAVPARVEVRFARRRGRDAADDDIVRIVAADSSPERLRVVTSDAELGRRVRALGAEVAGARQLLDALQPMDVPPEHREFARTAEAALAVDPMPTFEALAEATGVPVDTLVHLALVRWASAGAEALMAIEPQVLRDLFAARAREDWTAVAGIIDWLEAGS